MNCIIFRIERRAFWLGLITILVLSCTKYFKPVPLDTSNPEATGNSITASNQNKLLILRQGSYSYGMSNVSVDHDTMVLHATLLPLDPTNRQYVDAKPRRYGYTNDIVLKEMHIFSKDSSALDISKPFAISIDQIVKIELIEHDKGRTSTSYAIGIGISAGALIGIIAFIWNNAQVI